MKKSNIYVQEYQTYAPALVAKGEIDLALRLLSHVYADEYRENNDCSNLKVYFKNVQKKICEGAKEIDVNTIDSIRRCLDDRIVWISGDNFHDEHYINKNGVDCYRNFFWHSLQSRIDSWQRPNFPLDIIRKLLDNDFKKQWKKATYDRIHVLTEAGLIGLMTTDKHLNKKVCNIAFFDFCKTIDDDYEVWVVLKDGKKRIRVFTPCANAEKKEMSVKATKEVSIDHIIPLDLIIKQLEPELRETINKVINAKHDFPKDSDAAADKLRKEGKKLVEQLEELMTAVLEDTECVFMEQGENSKKSNNTPFVSYKKKENGKYTFIVAEHVLNPENHKKYKIFMEDDIFSGIQMVEEK